MLLAKYVTGPLKLYAGYEWIQFAPPSDAQTAFTNIAGLPMGAGFANGTAISNVAYSAGCAALTVCSDKILQVVWTDARYTIIPNLDVIGAYYHYSQSTFTNASCASLGSHSQCAGTFDAASAVLDWQFALATGAADMGTGGLAALLQARAQSPVPVKAILSIYTLQPDAIFTTADSGIATLKDVAGKNIATATFSSSNVVWPLVLKANGVDPAKVDVLKADPGALAPMLAAEKSPVRSTG